MGSKIRITDPYNWRPTNVPYRAYILVLDQEISEVIHLAESDAIPGPEDDEIFSRLATRYVELSWEYKDPKHDIIQADARDLAELSSVFGAEDGFSGLEVEKITITQD